jgi:nitrite reductase/ring-hydroxylating ferredoxin subunit
MIREKEREEAERTSQRRTFATINRCPHMGFPLDRGSDDDGILTCHWHHARLDPESGCTFDLWATMRRSARSRYATAKSG